MKRLILLTVLTAALVLAFGGLALANFGIHGAYMADTDACAGCHRAHTANSAITWTDSQGGNRSALLIVTPSKASSTVITDFCYTCHGSAAPGASTDVQTGQFDSSSNVPTENGNGPLNGGGFEQYEGTTTTSYHIIDTPWLMYGSTQASGSGYASYSFTLTCTQCHDVHGSSNYRILKDKVNGHTVGGYIARTAGERDTFNGMPVQDGNPTPNPWVVSAEYGYPDGTGNNGTDDLGFRLHKVYWPTVWSDNGPNTIPSAYDGATPSIPYKPNYTTARYGQPVGGNPMKGITGWCIACHEQYGTKTGVITVTASTTSTPGGVTDPVRTFGAVNTTATYDAGDGAGQAVRHRHPMNVPLSNFYINGNEDNGPVGDRALIYNPGTWQATVSANIKPVDIPLEHATTDGLSAKAITDAGVSSVVTDTAGRSIRVLNNTVNDYIGCLTCHRAHGTNATMKGYANVSSFLGSPDSDSGGVPPNNRSSLLRADNRGVCERCHNK